MMIGLGVFVLGEHRLTLLNWAGIGVSLTGIAWHHHFVAVPRKGLSKECGIEASPPLDYLPDKIFAFSRPCSAIQATPTHHQKHPKFGINGRSASVQPPPPNLRKRLGMDQDILAVAQLV